MSIPARYRRTHPAWGLGLIVGVPLVLFGLAWAATWAPRWIGLSPSDTDMRSLVLDEGELLVSMIETFMDQNGRPPYALGEIEVEESYWSLIDGSSGLMLVRDIGPNEVLEYVFDDPRNSEQPGWYRRSETGPRRVLKIEP